MGFENKHPAYDEVRTLRIPRPILNLPTDSEAPQQTCRRDGTTTPACKETVRQVNSHLCPLNLSWSLFILSNLPTISGGNRVELAPT
jgi:hypothetical protein